MLRSGSGSRPLARSILRLPSSNTRSTSSLAPVETRWPLVSRVCAIERRKNLAVTRHKLPTTSLQKYASSKVYVHPTPEQIAKEQEKMNTRVYERHPDKVSSVSTVRRIFHEQGEEPPEEEEEDIDMLAGVKSDLVRYYSFCYAVKHFTDYILLVESNQRNLCLRRSTSSSFNLRNGWRTSLPCNFSFNRLSGMGHQSCFIDWARSHILGEHR